MGVYDRVYAQVYGVIPAGRGVPEGGIDSLKIGKKSTFPRLCAVREVKFAEFGRFCRLGKFLSFRQFWDRRQYGPVKRTDAAFGWESSARGCVRR